MSKQMLSTNAIAINGEFSIDQHFGEIPYVGADKIIENYKDQAIAAIGGFSMDQHFGEIPYVGTNGNDLTQLYDLTNTLQLNFDVRTFNEKIGIYKDQANLNIIDNTNKTVYDGSRSDFLALSVDDFIGKIKETHIVSMGKYVSLYSDFKRKTNTYLGHADGFASIYDSNGASDINSGIFTPINLIDILSEKYYDVSGNYVYKLNGTIEINDLTNILTFLCNTNPFNNRTNQTIDDGFIAGDRILVSSGINITLELMIYNTDYIEEPLYSNSTILNHTINAPLLLILQNLS